MAIEIKVPALGKSVTEATVAKWFKAAGDAVALDEPLVELETDKVTLEVNAPAGGILAEIVAPVGSNVAVGALLGTLTEDAAAAKSTGPKPVVEQTRPSDVGGKPIQAPSPPPAPAHTPTAASTQAPSAAGTSGDNVLMLSPAVQRPIEENRLDPRKIPAYWQGRPINEGQRRRLHRIGRAGSGKARGRRRGPVPDSRLHGSNASVVGWARGARADDPAPQDGRSTLEGCAEHGGDADHVQ